MKSGSSKAARKKSAKKTDFEEASKKPKGRILKSGAANKTDTSFTARSLSLRSQDLKRVHLLKAATTAAASLNSKNAKQKNMDVDPKEWRAMVRLACSHAGHHSVKVRKDAAERLKRLLLHAALNPEHGYFSSSSVMPLVTDAIIRGWCDNEETVRNIYVQLTLYATTKGDAGKAESGLMVALTHARPDIRLTGRQVVQNLLIRSPNSENEQERSCIKDVWTMVEALHVHMRPVDASNFGRKQTDIHMLIPKLLAMLIVDQAGKEANHLVYEWQETQDRSLSLTRTTGRVSEAAFDSDKDAILGVFMDRLKLLWIEVIEPSSVGRSRRTEEEKKVLNYLKEACRVVGSLRPLAVPANLLKMLQ